MQAKKKTPKTDQRTSAGTSAEGFSAEECAAMHERSRELKAKSEGEAEVLAKISEMPESDRAIAERIHAIVQANAPTLVPRTWYGMPAYARDGNVVCFFQGASKFKTRYATVGFTDKAKLDDGEMWPVAFALTRLTEGVEEEIGALLRRAVK